MTVLRVVLILVHAGVSAIWLGAMAYSLVVVQPRARRFLADPDRYEQFAATIAAGARWKVIAMMAALAGSGAALVWLSPAEPTTAWITLVVVKSALLAVSIGLFWLVSWRLWPRRLFALPEELPALTRRFTIVALALSATVAANFVLGVFTSHTA